MKSVLITGGTGTFGRAFVRSCLQGGIKRIAIYSRDEHKQEEMAADLAGLDQLKTLRFFLGDVRDASRLKMACRGVDTIIHAAALKIVPKLEYDPIEAVRTNVTGTENVIMAAIDNGVRNVIGLSTDKAVQPVNLYGATKLTAERLLIAANNLSGSTGNYADSMATRFAVVRYGNVAGSRGSVIPLFKKMQALGLPLPITHADMTRFWISIDEAVHFVLRSLADMKGGEIFIPKMPSFRVVDLAVAIEGTELEWNGFKHTKVIGIRPGEKLHETLVTLHDSSRVVEHLRHYVIHPEWHSTAYEMLNLVYSSDTNVKWLSVQDLRRLV